MRALSLVLMENKCVDTDDITHSGINCFYFHVQSVSTNLAQWLASRSTAGGAHTQHSSEDVRLGGGATTLATLICQISAQEVGEPRASDIIELERWRAPRSPPLLTSTKAAEAAPPAGRAGECSQKETVHKRYRGQLPHTIKCYISLA